MLISVLLNNYNYAKFLSKAIESVLNQSYTNFELIIVDDGSTDSSKEIIKSYAKKDKRIKYLFKENAGQASALNEGIKLCRGEIISFLDSDDEFEKDKLLEVVNAYNKGYEYILNDVKIIGKNIDIPIFKYGGYNLFLVYYLTCFAGSVTSAIAISKKLAKKVFPIKNEEFFRIRADDAIVFSSAMLSESYFINKKLTKYRIHSNNNFSLNKKFQNLSYKYKRDIYLHQLKKDIVNLLNIEKRFFQNAYLLYLEFTTHQKFDKNILLLYIKILLNEMCVPFTNKIKFLLKIIRFYLKEKYGNY